MTARNARLRRIATLEQLNLSAGQRVACDHGGWKDVRTVVSITPEGWVECEDDGGRTWVDPEFITGTVPAGTELTVRGMTRAQILERMREAQAKLDSPRAYSSHFLDGAARTLDSLHDALRELEAKEAAAKVEAAAPTTEQLADAFDAHGIDSPFSADYAAAYAGEDGRRAYLRQYLDVPVIMELVKRAPDTWMTDVHDELASRRAAKARADRLEAIQKLDTTPAVRAFLAERVDTRGVQTVLLTDKRSWIQQAKWAMSARAIPHPTYTPDPGCQAKLKLERAVHFAHRQEPYADHAEYAIPVELEPGADLAVCKRNLARFCASLRTATGFAGEGSSYSAELVVTPEGALVHFDVRSSIAD